MAKPLISACPFCGPSSSPVYVGRRSICVYYVRCDGCATEGPPVEHGAYEANEARAERDAIRAWNRRCKTSTGSRVTIADAERIARAHDNQAVVVLGVGRKGDVTVTTWGETPAKCASIGDWASGLWQNAVSKVPFQTVFGWGNGGKPKPLTEAERAALTAGGRDYDARHQEHAR